MTRSIAVTRHCAISYTRGIFTIENSGCCRKPAVVTRPRCIDDYDRAIQGKEQPPAGERKLDGINDRLTSYLPQRIIYVVTHRLATMGSLSVRRNTAVPPTKPPLSLFPRNGSLRVRNDGRHVANQAADCRITCACL